jgi:microcystin-dependent protein
MSIVIDPSTGLSVNGAQFLIGEVKFFPATSAPAGHVKANGALLSRTTYALLWAYAQTSGNLSATDGAWAAGQFSPGDGSTTFRVPELRGEFIRGLDDGRGIDTGRVVGSAQSDVFKDHTHGMNATIQDNGAVVYNVTGGGRGGAVNVTGTASSPNNGGAETRPRNVGLLACIYAGA